MTEFTGLKNCRIFDGYEFIDGLADITFSSGIIKAIGRITAKKNTYDCEGKTVVPGFVDIHTHGIAGYDNSDINLEEFPIMEREYNSRGTTTFVPTFPTIDKDTAKKSFFVYEKYRNYIPGIHLEGPFINSEKKGAQNPDYIIEPSVENFMEFAGEYSDLVCRVTISPETDKDLILTNYLLGKGIVVSPGHTTSSYEKALAFMEHTSGIATHLFNAMPPIHHRNPGITTAALMNEGTACEIIPDMIHLHPAIVKMVFKLKGPEKTICISDSIMAAGLSPGKYNFSGLDISVDGSSARLESGNLAGSIISMADGVRNMIRIGIDEKSAYMSATSSPASAMGLEKTAGVIAVGRNADLVVLDDENRVVDVFKKGKRVI